MKNSNVFYVAAFALTSAFATAQINQTPVQTTTGYGQITVMKEKSQAATGSMFIDEKYMPAKITGLDKTVLLRYNAYADNFQISEPTEGTEKVLPARGGVTITFTGTLAEYTYQQYKTEKEEVVSGYLSIISDNPNVKIFKRERVILQPEVFPASSYQSYKPANYKKAGDEFYVKINDQDAVFFSGKKDLAKLFPAKSKEVLDYIKKNKIDLEKEGDLEKLGLFLNTLV